MWNRLQSDKDNSMKIASTIARYLLGLMLTVFGLNGFLNFIPVTAMPPLAGQFFGVLMASHYMVLVFLLQIACGLLFLSGRYIPLALTLIGPVIVNILLFHVLMNPGGIVPGVIATVCWFIVFYSVRSAFAGIFRHQG
jgi:putative oxidoreductase